jgi:undecaprenyl-diphosphatase
MKFLRAHIRLVLLNIISLIVFIFLAVLVVGGGIWNIDQTHSSIAAYKQSGAWTTLALLVSTFLHPVVLLVAGFLIAGFLYFHKRYLFANVFIAVFVASIGLGIALKGMFDIARPINSYSEVLGGSFPSLHAISAAVFFLTILYALEHRIHDRVLGAIIAVVAIFLVVISGLSRLYLEVHWPSDVAAGFAFGIFSATLGILVLKNYESKVLK